MTNFQIYKAEINRLLEKTQTGGGWDVAVWIDTKIPSDAECRFCVGARWVTFRIDDIKTKNYTKKMLVSLAKHEFGHFVTARLSALAERRFVTQSEIDEELEAIARIFERM